MSGGDRECPTDDVYVWGSVHPCHGCPWGACVVPAGFPVLLLVDTFVFPVALVSALVLQASVLRLSVSVVTRPPDRSRVHRPRVHERG